MSVMLFTSGSVLVMAIVAILICDAVSINSCPLKPGGDVDAVVPFAFDGQRIFTITLRSDVGALASRSYWALVCGPPILARCFRRAFAVSTKLQRVISEPVLQLLEKMKLVPPRQNYCSRVSRETADELGNPIIGFNEMLDEIELSDDPVRKHHAEHEEKVAGRTAELVKEKDGAAPTSRAKSQLGIWPTVAGAGLPAGVPPMPEPMGEPPPTHTGEAKRGAAAGAKAVIDEESLNSIRALQRAHAPSLLHKVVDCYFDDSARLLDCMRSAAAAEDAAALRQAAHALKSSSACLGANGLATLCQQMELMARDLASVSMELMARIETEYAAAHEALAAIRNGEGA